jgi:hypothetical protein
MVQQCLNGDIGCMHFPVVQAICEKWRSINEEIVLKQIINCSKSISLDGYLLSIRDKWEMCVNRMELSFINMNYSNNLGE